MKKVILALGLMALTQVANAAPMNLIVHNETSGSGTVYSMINDGSHVDGNIGASTATWDWDGTTMTATGLYSNTQSLGSGPYGPSLQSEETMNLTIDTGTSTAGGTSYTCIEGTFFAQFGHTTCGNYSFGDNGVDESTTVWSGITTSQTLGGDDAGFGGGPRTIAYSFNLGLESFTGTGMNPGDMVILGNGIPVGTAGSIQMSFQVVPVPAAAWLFGSALGLLGWMRRKSA